MPALTSMAAAIKRGAREALPIVFGYVPIAMAYGLLSQQAGLSVWVTLGLSVFVFAGAAQFMAVSMLSRGAEAVVIIGSTLVVNFRHVLMSASVTPFLSSWRTWQRVMLGSMLTDESFALHSIRFANGDLDPAAAITLNVTAYAAWVASGVLGYHIGAMVERPDVWGLDFALPSMFAGLLMMSCRSRPAVAAALCGGAASLILCLIGVDNWAAFLGAIVGATAGVCVKDDHRS